MALFMCGYIDAVWKYIPRVSDCRIPQARLAIHTERETMRLCRLSFLAVLILLTTISLTLLWAPTTFQASYTEPYPAGSKALCEEEPVNWIWPIEKECASCASKSNKWNTFLPKRVMDGVQYLLLFTGHGRSGGSIVGSLIDAHPNAVVANQYMLFPHFVSNPAYHDTKEKIFGRIVNYAQRQKVRKSRDRKGYTLSVGNGTEVDESTHLVVIGDKGAGVFAGEYVSEPERFGRVFAKLKETVQVPVKIIQVVRNPFDNIATEVIYRTGNAKLRVKLVNGSRPPLTLSEIGSRLECAIHKYFSQVYAIMKMETALDLDLMRLHLVDLVTNPRQYLQEICDFLHLDCTEDYLKTCEETIFSEVSQTRGLIEWRPDQLALVQELIDEVKWLRRYSLTQD